MTISRFLLTAASLLVVSTQISCVQPKSLPQDETEAIVEFADPILVNALEGLSLGDYERHSRDFDSELKEQIDRVTFPIVYDQITGALGPYQDYALDRAEDRGRQIAVIYHVAFQNDDNAIVTLVFWKSDPEMKVAGFWIESELLQ